MRWALRCSGAALRRGEGGVAPKDTKVISFRHFPTFHFSHQKTIVFGSFQKHRHRNANHSFWRSSEFLSISGSFFVTNHYLSFVHFLSMILGGGVNESGCLFDVDLAPNMTFILNCLLFVFVNLLLHVMAFPSWAKYQKPPAS